MPKKVRDMWGFNEWKYTRNAVVDKQTKESNFVYFMKRKHRIIENDRKNSFLENLCVRNKKTNIPTVKNGAHVGKKYQALIDSGAGISPREVNASNENPRTDGVFDVKKGKQIAMIR